MKEYDVIGIGNALLDITLKVDDDFLHSIGLKKGHMTLVDEKQFIHILSLISKKEQAKSSGGSAANTIIGIAKLGGRSAYIGKIGKDENGKLYEQNLREDGVITKVATDSTNTKTGTAVTFITSDGERTFATYLGAAIKLTADDIDEKEILKAKILHIEGYVLEEKHLREAAIKAMKIAKKEHILISVDLADPSLIKRNLDLFKHLVEEYVDIVFANEDEAEAFTGTTGDQAVIEIDKNCHICVVKLGKKGSVLKKGDLIHRVPIYEVVAVNSNGAGDAYAAGILYAVANNLSLEEAGKIAAYISSQVVNSHEATVRRSLKHEITKLE